MKCLSLFVKGYDEVGHCGINLGHWFKLQNILPVSTPDKSQGGSFIF